MLTSIKKYEMPQLVYDFLFRELPYKKVTVQKVVISLRRPTKEEYHKILY
jgi:preprotein translocase subunit Sss1